MTLTSKTAIITGSNSGIGLGVARELARAGADVVINSFTDRDEDHDLARELSRETGAPVHGFGPATAGRNAVMETLAATVSPVAAKGSITPSRPTMRCRMGPRSPATAGASRSCTRPVTSATTSPLAGGTAVLPEIW